jgi:hypothetical protein
MSEFYKQEQAELDALFVAHGVFFAFGDEQFKAAAPVGAKIASFGAGCFLPDANVTAFKKEFSALTNAQRLRKRNAHGLPRIIEEVLNNHECFYMGEVTEESYEEALSYGATREQVTQVFYDRKNAYADQL